MGNKCVFLDRDGVLNVDAGTYTFELEKFFIVDRTPDALQLLKKNGFKLIVITNQAGIAKGMYSANEVLNCHHKLQEACNHCIDDIYFSPYHPSVTESLSRKPDSILFERAIAKYNVDVGQSWMIGDKERDLIPAKKAGINGRVLIPYGEEKSDFVTHYSQSLWEATTKVILKSL